MSFRLVRPAVVLLASTAVLACSAGPAAAAVPCWKKLMNDWYTPPITNTYPLACYHEAIKHLPLDVQEYSSARDDIQRALQQAIADQRRSHDTTTAETTTSGTTTTTTRTATGHTTPTTTTTPTKHKKKGPVGRALRDITPGGADSFPLPLLILGLLAILLVAAGVAGLVWRRLQGRRGLP